MTFSASTIFIIVGALTFFVIVLLVILIVRELLENRRLRKERMPEPTVPPHPAGQDREAAPTPPWGAYSYDSIVMDEVLGEKLIDELKRSLRMTEEMYQKLSERFKDDRDRRIELANDWLNYLEAVDSIKQSRVDYRMNNSDNESQTRERDASRIKLEIENKFKSLQQASTPPPVAG